MNQDNETRNIGDFVHNNKTHRSSHDAFKDAKYASWFESDPEMSDMRVFLTEFLCFAVPLIITVCLVVFFVFKAVALS